MTFSAAATNDRYAGAMREATTAPLPPEQDAFLRTRILALCDAGWGRHAALAKALSLTKHRFHYLLHRPGRLRLRHLAVIAPFFGFTVETLLSPAPLPQPLGGAPAPRVARAQLRARLRELTDEQLVAVYGDLMAVLGRTGGAGESSMPAAPARDLLASWSVTGRTPLPSRPLAPLL